MISRCSAEGALFCWRGCPASKQQADLIKLSDADLLWLLNMPLATALLNPAAVGEDLHASVWYSEGGLGVG
jgi:hypothetical protein